DVDRLPVGQRLPWRDHALEPCAQADGPVAPVRTADLGRSRLGGHDRVSGGRSSCGLGKGRSSARANSAIMPTTMRRFVTKIWMTPQWTYRPAPSASISMLSTLRAVGPA